ncbi:class I SAM-dependent methyltransferase [Leeuwenhoekiella sp. W20_SRS_FM14]|uniref:class I SAM-dependent methyltransferase n=1 Tax=Leeuwenhoekiella sp. W20_SRS_FM14 TaxID=3240270 RepID=UPI003F9AB827
MRIIEEFYNNFDEKLIKDYVLGNKRIESAIINLASFIPQNSKSILDIGCGLGWSSHEFAKHFKDTTVEGIDLSTVLVEAAKRLFTNGNLSFKVFDVTQNLPGKHYDAVIMIDVYEHIPFNERSKFHKAIKEILKDQGRLLLACPSKYHQKWLRDNDPAGLQPVDEDVDYGSINQIAKDIDGEVIFFEYIKIWCSFDYFYAVIDKNPKYNSNVTIRNHNLLNLEEPTSRLKRVNSNMGLQMKSSKEAARFKGYYFMKKTLNFFK